MSSSNVLILNAGGIRSLVATALMSMGQGRVVLLHIDDGRPSSFYARDAFKRQADHYKITDSIAISLPHISTISRRYADSPLKMQRSIYGQAIMLMTAMDLAVQHKLERVVWPIQVGESFKTLAKITETQEMVEQISEIWRERPVLIETPFIEMELTQLVELGQQLNVPWSTTRDCRENTEQPCGQCEWCLMRNAAFEATSIDMPLPPEDGHHHD